MHSFQPAPATAAPTTTASAGAPGDRSQEFRPVSGGPETASGATLVVLAYAAIWLIVFGLVLLHRSKQRAIEARLAALEAALKRAAAAPAAGSPEGGDAAR